MDELKASKIWQEEKWLENTFDCPWVIEEKSRRNGI